MKHELPGPTCTQSKGFVLGTGAKIFTIVGPVIVYGTVASVIYVFIYWILKMI
jgi:stage V sporulation protein AC